MRNSLGVILAAIGAGLIALAFSRDAALITTGVALLLGSLLVVIDWDEA